MLNNTDLNEFIAKYYEELDEVQVLPDDEINESVEDYWESHNVEF